MFKCHKEDLCFNTSLYMAIVLGGLLLTCRVNGVIWRVLGLWRFAVIVTACHNAAIMSGVSLCSFGRGVFIIYGVRILSIAYRS